MKQTRWQQPRTQKVYLQAPLAQRVLMLWPDFKLTNYAFADNGKHVRQESTGFILLHGADNAQADFKATEFDPVRGGLPVYTLRNDIGCRVSMEAFGNSERNPTVYAKITLKNDRSYPVADCIGLLARTGDDLYLSSIHDTGYSSYRPNVGTWYLLKKNWEADGFTATDGRGHLRLQPSENLRGEWVALDEPCDKFAADRYFRFRYALEPGEEAVLTVGQTYGQPVAAFDYEAEKQAATAFWHALLGQIRRFPDTDNDGYRDIFLSQVTQCLQMLARYPDKEWIVPRQGDLGCYIWPWEAAHFLIPLDRIGLSQYTGLAWRYFIEAWFRDGGDDDGKIMSRHQQWGNLNGSVIWGVSEHLLYTRDAVEYAYFKPYLDRCLDWIQRERKKSEDAPGCLYKGIFPVGKASDWNDLGQFWIFTDGTNVRGVESMARLYEVFGDGDAAYVRGVFEEYRGRLREIAEVLYRGHESEEAFLLPHQLGPDFEDTETYCFTLSGHPHLYELGILDPRERRFAQMEAYFRRRGLLNDSLAGRMTNVSGGDHGLYAEVYYTVNAEKTWLGAWKTRGEDEKAAKMLEGLLKYCLTKEYIVSERYSPDDPWFSPWQPNASSSGRVLSILLDYFGEKEADI